MVIASHLVGRSGRVCGIDLISDMADRARANLTLGSVTNAQVDVAGAEAIPFANSSFDVVTSNGAFNLSPLKEQSFAEVVAFCNRAGESSLPTSP